MNLTEIREVINEQLENLRDTGGPYGCYRAGPGCRPDLYASLDVALMRVIMGENLLETVTDEQRRQWIDHINSFLLWRRGEEKDGSYGDTLKHSALHANGMSIGALGVLGGQQACRVKLYEAFDTEDKVEHWLEHEVNWFIQWASSHKFWGGMHCYSMSKHCTDSWRRCVFAWLDANVDEQTGWWKKGTPHSDRHQPLGGSVHILPIYEHHDHPFPYPERVVDSVLALQLPNGRWFDRDDPCVMTYLELDALYALSVMRRWVPDYRKDEVHEAVVRYDKLVRDYWPETGVELTRKHHPHWILAAVGTFGLMQQLLPEQYTDSVQWTDIFSDLRFYQTHNVECDEVPEG